MAYANIAWPNTGELNRKVRVRKWQDAAAVDMGIAQEYDEGLTCWAKVQPVTGVLYWAGKQIGNDVTHIFWVRYRTGTKPEQITGEHVVEWNGRRYRVKNATNAEDAQVFTFIETTDLGLIADPVADVVIETGGNATAANADIYSGGGA